MPQKIKFRVVHVTSQDDDFPAKELNHRSPLTKGWQSEKNCTYPQQIVIDLKCRCHIRKIQILSHQFLIASKVEFLIGDYCEHATSNFEPSKFTRLGHVDLSNNEDTLYKSRELKSVHVDAIGACFQLLFYKNYSNRYNIDNQIGIVALNFLGEILDPSFRRGSPADNVIRSEYTSPVDDLAFDLYQDPRLEDILRRLQCQKLEYARQENFDLARQTRDAIKNIQETGERLLRLELEKQEAAKLEDYERAKEKKEEILQIHEKLRRDIDLQYLLPLKNRTNAVRDHKHGFVESDRPLTNGSGNCSRTTESPFSADNRTDETTSNSFGISDSDVENESSCDESQALANNSHRFYRNIADERPLPTLITKQENNSAAAHSSDPDIDIPKDIVNRGDVRVESLPGNSPDPNHNGSLEKLSDANFRHAMVAIDVVGLDLVTKTYSKYWRLREESLHELELRVCSAELPPPASIASKENAEPDPLAELRSTTFILCKALNDQVLSIYRTALRLIYPTIVAFGEQYGLFRQDVLICIDRFVPMLVQRSGDSAQRFREATKQQIIEMAQWPSLQHGSIFWQELVRPFPQTALERLALSRVEILTELYALIGVTREKSSLQPTAITDIALSGLAIDALTTFTVHALEHRSNEVRELAETLMVAIYRAEDRKLVRCLLPPIDHESRRQPLYRRLFAKFDRLDGRLPKPNNTISSVQKPIQQSGLKKPSQQKHNDVKKANNGGHEQKKSHSNIRRSTNKPSLHDVTFSTNAEDIDLLLSLDKTCIFCGEQDDNFTEEALDLHYWKSCPMLRRCPNCKQVVEISSLTDHLLLECDSSKSMGGYSRCPICTEAMPNSQHATHVEEATCTPSADPSLRCPLCHSDIPGHSPENSADGLEEAWKCHLMGTSNPDRACPQNSRRKPVVASSQHSQKAGDSWPFTKPQAMPTKQSNKNAGSKLISSRSKT